MAKKKKPDHNKLLHLIEIGLALSSEKELNSLFKVILEKAVDLTDAEGASLFLVRENPKQVMGDTVTLQKESKLYMIKSLNRIKGEMDHSHSLILDKTSIAGHVAQGKKPIRIDNIDQISKTKYNLNPLFDRAYHSNLKTLLSVPMMTADGRVRGVLQLVNKLKPEALDSLVKHNKISSDSIIAFDANDEDILKHFSKYSAIALENAQLTESIENLFESFVRASVKAIESRDPTTSGHSDRVAMMTVELALATHKVGEGPYKSVIFSEEQIKELRYASLLHDFGKIGVTEPVLLKKKKLKDRDLESILLRFDSMGYLEETLLWKNLCERIIEEQRRATTPFDADQAFKNTIEKIDFLKHKIKKMRSHVITANEPQVMSDDFDINELVLQITKDNQFFNNNVLTQEELKTLSIPRGSLTLTERHEIESHVSHTYEFLKQIAWTENLSHVTTIAHCHHEKMDGTGYPRGLREEAIPIQSRMMTIADIYDALTAFDRPYKKSVSPARALEILIKDARSHKIDGHLLKIFIEAGIFHHATLGTIKKVS